MDVALLQYILKKKKEGISDEEISQKLLAQGWPKEAIDEGLHHVASHPEQVEFHEQTFSPALVGPMELLNRSFELLMQNIGSVIFLSFVPSVLGFLFVIVSIFIPFILFNSSGSWNIFASPSSICAST
jgi:lipopolysaccharide export LptBFGC system permease protein LptF